MRVFISHSSQDKPQVEALARALRERGFETWLDKWELQAGDDLVASINRGLDEAQAGVVVFSAAAAQSLWVTAETRYLIWAAIEEGKPLIPVVIDDGAPIPPLVRPLLRKGIGEVDAIADALRNRRAGPPPVRSAAAGTTEPVMVTLRRGAADGSLRVEVRLRGQVFAEESFPRLPAEVIHGRKLFLRGFRSGARRDPATAERAGREADLADLGRALWPVCFPGDAAGALAELLKGSPLGTTVEVRFESDDTELLGLPFETLRLPDDQLLAIHPKVVMLRRPLGLAPARAARLAGPLKILVAVGAPDEDRTPNVVLDHERELQNILDAVEEARSRDNVEVRILEVGSPDQIGEALERDAYHVLHLSCHGSPGVLELETEDGAALRVTAEDLLKPLQSKGRPLPLVFLNSCHGAVSDGDTASLAEELLRAGVPSVLAMQTSVTDHYATRLARGFYEHLARPDAPRASRALAEARRELEDDRRRALSSGASSPGETQPEAATATLYLAGDESPLLDPSLPREDLLARPVYEVSGPVPQLRMDDLIGRRKELRQTLRTLRDGSRRFAGVALTGLGGVGKSAMAGRAMQRLSEDGWTIAAHSGRFDLAAIAGAVLEKLLLSDVKRQKALGERFRELLDDRFRLALLTEALTKEHLLLVLDDFELNLPTGGGSFLDPDTPAYLNVLAQNAHQGRLLITCRHPVPGFEPVIDHLSLGSLSDAEVRKLLLRLPGLRDRPPAELRKILRRIGGHPRTLELLDALLRGGQGRLAPVTQKLQNLLDQEDFDLDAKTASLDERLHQAILLGTRDVMLDELLTVARGEGIEEALLQLAVSNMPVSADGLSRMLAEDPGQPGDPEPAEKALERLADLSLVFRLPDGSGWVHRWTAEGLAKLSDPDAHRQRCNRAGRYRWWRVEDETHDLGDAIEAVRNHLQGQDFDAATGIAKACFGALRRFRQSAGIAALAAEVLETLPLEHGNYAFIADEEAEAHLALGWTERAKERYELLLALYQRRVEVEPDRASYQRNLLVSYIKMGDLYKALGQGRSARASYQRSIEISEHLSLSEPDRADYQRDLSVSHIKMGDLYGALGEGESARASYERALEISERLSLSEPDRADYQRDLAVSYSKVGDLYRALGQGESARASYQRTLAITERLSLSEPDRADYQRDLSASYNRLGDLYKALGQSGAALDAYQKDLEIAERLALSEPDRADYQRDLSVSYNKMGEFYLSLGQLGPALDAFERDLEIAERLASLEPDRADYQVDLAISLFRVGGLRGPAGRPSLERALMLLHALQADGRLSPTDQPMIESIRQLLAALDAPTEEAPPD